MCSTCYDVFIRPLIPPVIYAGETERFEILFFPKKLDNKKDQQGRGYLMRKYGFVNIYEAIKTKQKHKRDVERVAEDSRGTDEDGNMLAIVFKKKTLITRC